MQYKIQAVDASSQLVMIEFLKQHENYTLFLLNNFENYGPKLGESPFSGNFKLILSSNKIVGVFCLTKKGTLLIESTVVEPIFATILASCREELIQIVGVIGNWDFCAPFWDFLKREKVIEQEIRTSKEILYNVDLASVPYNSQPNVRLLTEADFAAWKPLRVDSITESGFPNTLTEEQFYTFFLEKVHKKIIWGLFSENRLVSQADLNAQAFDLGQVGGVYTPPQHRQKGYSLSVMKQLLLDAKKLHALRKLIIFTGEKNLPAQKLYNSLGAAPIGHFALLFGK